jgi:large subunit ribosomal protein L22
LKTSIKKLGNLMRQVQHKDVDHAITQMRFSPKRAARLVFRGLEHAKEEAIRLHGMKDGQVIVDQAWVGRNKFRRQIWPRARGRANFRMRPYSHFTVLLRHAQIAKERLEKKKEKKLESIVWKRKDYRPIYNARPYYAW